MAVTAPVRVRRQAEPAPPARTATGARAVRVVEPPPRRSPRHVGRGAALLAIALVGGSLLVTVAANAYLTQGQILLARLQQQVAVQSNEHRDLELQVAQLESPTHLVTQAERQGLVAPTAVGDLAQVDLQVPLTVPASQATEVAPAHAARAAHAATVVPAGTGR